MVSWEKVNEEIDSYNIITNYHMNLFANGILTSCVFSNIYPVEDMKYVKTENETISLKDLDEIDEKYIHGLRLNEVSSNFRGNKKSTISYIKEYVRNLIVKEKYVLDYKYASENNKNIDEIYSADTVLQYLLDKNIIEQLKDINDNIVENQYFINPDALNSDIATNVINGNGSNSNGTKVFKIKQLEDKYMIYFVNKFGDEEELGELVMKPEV